MSENLDWTKDLGDAFLAQKDDVLDTVQRMRAKAYEAGTLKTTKEQVVTREVVKEKEIIQVEPADPAGRLRAAVQLEHGVRLGVGATRRSRTTRR